ncbi:hypothetical protein [Novosphingobium colocasiae]|uniref:Bbp19 family protein n=1 Tax=Novosphingobium colocasiae TaxID=1256513 RepID=UPI0035AD7E56
MRGQVNQLRKWAIRVSKIYKDLFRSTLVPRSRVYRWLFGHPEGGLSPVGEMVLWDLRRFCHAGDATVFNTDPLEMARREGRREVFVRIQNMLSLDEFQVRQLMEIDDGDE